MTAIKTLTAVAAGALALSAAGVVQAQTPYSASPAPQSQDQGERVLETILGALFGNGQTSLESEWGRGRRPLYNQRAAFETRVEAGVRDRTLSRRQGDQLRADYTDLVALETRYAADGRITTTERTELSRQYRELTAQLDSGGYDDGDDYDRWDRIADMSGEFETRVAAALRNRDITRAESNRLRTDFQALVRLEADYERNGLDSRERQDLTTRLDELNRRVGDDYDSGNGGSGAYNPNGRHVADIEARIASGERSGAINRTEAERVRTELADLTRLEAAYVPNGLNADERAYLSRRFGELDARVRAYRR